MNFDTENQADEIETDGHDFNDHVDTDDQDHAGEENEGEENFENDSGDDEGGQDDTQGKQAKSQKKEVWPKKAVNALNRAKKKEAYLTRQIAEMRQAVEEIRNSSSGQQRADDLKEPKETDFNSYSEYLDAVDDYRIELKLREREAKRAQNDNDLAAQQRQMQDFQRRTQVIETRAAQMAKVIPDLQETILNSGVNYLSDKSKELIYGSSNPTLAVYNLEKAGQLELLEEMSPIQAANFIERYAAKRPANLRTNGNQNGNQNNGRNFSARKPINGGGGAGGDGGNFENMATSKLLSKIFSDD